MSIDFICLCPTGINSSDFGDNYIKTDDKVKKCTKKIGIFWCTLMFIMTSGPFTDAFIDHFIRKDDEISWQLLYATST